MDTPNTSYNRGPQIEKPSTGPKFNGRAFAGIIVIIVGTVFLLRQLNIDFPHWIVSWQMLLIAIGVFTGARHSFKGLGWMVPIFIGSVFLVSEIISDFPMHRFFWPVFVIGIGLYMIFRSKKKDELFWGAIDSNDDKFDATAIFGGVKKNIITKNFKGGDITSMFGGSEINLVQADINGRALLDVTTIFGGTKIIVPPHWQVNSDGIMSILGGIEDKRAIMANPSPDPNKVLVIRGTVMFGGIELKSF